MIKSNSHPLSATPAQWSTRWQQWCQRIFARRVPVILQLNETECGAACLAMILSYFGRKTSVAECRTLLDVHRDGVTAQAIAREARTFGLIVRAFSVEPTDLRDLPQPAILFWEFNHFVVLERWSPTHVDIIDPAIGRRRLSSAAFDAGFTGVVLTLAPGLEFRPRRRVAERSWVGYLYQVLLEQRTMLWQILGASLLVQLLALAAPLFTQILIDRVLPGRNVDTLTLFGIGVVLLTVAHALINVVRDLLLLNLQVRLDVRLMTGFVDHLFRLPFAFFQQRASGDLLMRLRSNTELRETLTGEALSLVLDSVLVLTYLGFLLWREPMLAALTLGVGALQVALLLGTARHQRRLATETLVAEAQEQSYLVEAIQGIATLKATGAEPRAFATWENLFYGALNATTRKNYATLLIDNSRWLLRALAPLLLLWVGIYKVMSGQLALGEMLALTSVAMLFLSPLSSLVRSVQRLQLAGAHLERIADVLAAEPEASPATPTSARSLQGAIELENVSFHYHADGPAVLSNISLTIQPGQKVAIVGRSGAGKSTLGYLLLRMYQPTTGTIYYDGIAATAWALPDLRRQLGVVLQDPFLFSGSIRQNIAFHAPDLAMETIRAVAKLAAIHDEIVAMPMGYETHIGEDGNTISGGQRQRLALARALAPAPAILLLDEATSHLDALTEQALEQSLNALSCTRIVIAHRLSTVRNADLIVVLEQGRIVEQGTHEALLARNGHYAALVYSQQMEPNPNGEAED